MNFDNLLSGFLGSAFAVVASYGLVKWQEDERIREKQRDAARTGLLIISQVRDMRTASVVSRNSTSIYQRDLDGLIALSKDLLPKFIEISDTELVIQYGKLISALSNLRIHANQGSSGFYHRLEETIDALSDKISQQLNKTILSEH